MAVSGLRAWGVGAAAESQECDAEGEQYTQEQELNAGAEGGGRAGGQSFPRVVLAIRKALKSKKKSGGGGDYHTEPLSLPIH